MVADFEHLPPPFVLVEVWPTASAAFAETAASSFAAASAASNVGACAVDLLAVPVESACGAALEAVLEAACAVASVVEGEAVTEEAACVVALEAALEAERCSSVASSVAAYAASSGSVVA